MLHRLARRLTRDPGSAEDLVQDTYVKALAAWDRGTPDDVPAWLATICLNLARTRWRRSASRPERLVADAGRDLVAHEDPATDAVHRVRRDAVHAALWRLPEAQREAITLMDLCGFTAAEVATMTDNPRGTILARVHRGRKALALRLREHAPDPAVPRRRGAAVSPRRRGRRRGLPGGAMSPAERAAHEQHLLRLRGLLDRGGAGRHGRSLAEESRELAPAGLLERIRAEVGAAATTPPRTTAVDAGPLPTSGAGPRGRGARRRVRRGRRGGGALLLPLPDRATVVATGSPSVAEAVARFRDGRLPGDSTPSLAVPDLASIGLHPVGAAAGELGGESVTGFAYADDTGRRVVVYLSETPFPRVSGAEQISGADGPWIARSDGVVLLCARLPHAMLLVGQDVALVRSAAVELDAI